jgi:hypothetical protein
MLENAVARGKGYLPTIFKPKGNGGFDGIFRDGDKFVIVEGKLGIHPSLNPANQVTGNPAQMSQDSIRQNVDKAIGELRQYDNQFANELEAAYKAGRIKGTVVKTTIDGKANALDPEFVIKELSEIGRTTF